MTIARALRIATMVALGAAAFCATGCDEKEGDGAADAGASSDAADGSTADANDAGSDATSDATDATDATDAAPGANDAVADGPDASETDADDGSTCPASLATVCANVEQPGEFGVSCEPTWADALADTHYCGTTVTLLTEECGPYHAWVAVNVDVSFTYLYDATTGALVAVLGEGISGAVQCIGGPPGFVVPACTGGTHRDPCGVDAATD